VTTRPPGIGNLRFAVLASLRAVQLMRGCTPKVESAHKAIVTAQIEVSSGAVAQWSAPGAAPEVTGAADQTALEGDDAVVPGRAADA
jgi:hypothetical protein